MVANLLQWFARIPEDVQEAGRNWYHDVRAWATFQAAEFGITVWQMAAVIAVLSPRTDWGKNLQLARQVPLIWKAGGKLEDALTLPTIKSQIGKAWDILEGYPEALSGPKTSSFCDNIARLESEAVTVDVWAMRAAKYDLNASYSDITRRYTEFVDAYRELALHIGCRPYEAQAMVWVWVRDLARRGKNGRYWNLEQLTLL